MATATIPPAARLTYEQFQEQYERGDKGYEYWYGEEIPKGMPTLVHGFLQMIIIILLRDAGLHAASEVELCIKPGARPKPDVIASRTVTMETYPTKAWDVVVEILSEDDSYTVLRGKCKKYQE